MSKEGVTLLGNFLRDARKLQHHLRMEGAGPDLCLALQRLEQASAAAFREGEAATRTILLGIAMQKASDLNTKYQHSTDSLERRVATLSRAVQKAISLM